MRNKPAYIISALLILALACTPAPREAQQHLIKGINAMEAGELDEAIKYFDKAAAADSTVAEAWYYQAVCLFNKDHKNAVAAVGCLSKAIEQDSAYAEAYTTRGEIRFYLGDHDGACRDWKAAFRLGKVNLRDKTKFCKE